jgi:hypothetical protein
MTLDWYTEMLHRCYGGAFERRVERDALAAGTRRAETRSKAPSEGCQSGPAQQGNAQTPPSSARPNND